MAAGLASDPVFDMGFRDQGLIQENKYCRIWWALEADRRIIVKTYRGADPALARQEADALELYHRIVASDPAFIDSRCLGFDEGRNLLRIAFVEGRCLTELLYAGRKDDGARRRAIAAMGLLGRFSRRLWDETRSEATAPTPFLLEYLEHCSRRLEALPVFGRLCFAGAREEARVLWKELVASGEASSYCHGDMVFRNVHVHEDRVGLIDFANALPASHVLNDAYNLRLALANTWLAPRYKAELWKAYEEALHMERFSEAAHRFYFEYHRRRWLQLKLWAFRPWPCMQALRAMLTFARPRELEVLG